MQNSQNGNIKILVGMASCGIAAGAADVYSALEKTIAEEHLPVELEKTGCIGACYREPLVEINPKDAEKLNVSEGDYIKITSRRGSIKVKAWLTERPGPGVVFVPFHFHEAAVNKLTHAIVDPVAKIPEFKVSAVKIEKVS